MNNKKSKKKLFAVIGGSVLAFVLTVVVSVAVTLAYFGNATAGETTLKMGEAVTVGTAVSDTSDLENVLPGQLINMEVKATVAQSTTTSYLAAVIEIEADSTTATEEDLAALKSLVATTSDWTSTSSNFVGTIGEVAFTNASTVYVLGDLDALDVVDSTDDVVEKTLITSPVRVSKNLTNTVAEATLTIKVAFIAVQSSIEDAANTTTPDGFLTSSAWSAAIEEAFEMVSGGTITANA